MKQVPKILVTESDRIGEEILDGTIDSVIESLKKLKSAGWTKLGTEGYGYDGDYEIVVYKEREETDVEYEIRLKQIESEKKKKEKTKEARRKQYELLKKEFESQIPLDKSRGL